MDHRDASKISALLAGASGGLSTPPAYSPSPQKTVDRVTNYGSNRSFFNLNTLSGGPQPLEVGGSAETRGARPFDTSLPGWGPPVLLLCPVKREETKKG